MKPEFYYKLRRMNLRKQIDWDKITNNLCKCLFLWLFYGWQNYSMRFWKSKKKSNKWWKRFVACTYKHKGSRDYVRKWMIYLRLYQSQYWEWIKDSKGLDKLFDCYVRQIYCKLLKGNNWERNDVHLVFYWFRNSLW